jgi:hypothetical protein
VHVQHDWQLTGGAAWLDEQDLNVPDLNSDGQPRLIDIGHLSRTRLRGIDRLASICQRQLGEGRPLGDECDQIRCRLL